MRFIDANVFIYAILKPRRQLTDRECRIKTIAKRILERIDKGEEVVTSVVHLSEVANILEDIAGITFTTSFIRDLLFKGNIHVEKVTMEDYLESTLLAREKSISINDALAYIIMKRRKINEIYTFDKHFRELDVRIIQE